MHPLYVVQPNLHCCQICVLPVFSSRPSLWSSLSPFTNFKWRDKDIIITFSFTGSLTGGSQGLVDGRLEAAHMLHCRAVCFHWLHVLVQDGKNLIVQNLVLPDPVSHFLKWLWKDKQGKVRRNGWSHSATCLALKEVTQSTGKMNVWSRLFQFFAGRDKSVTFSSDDIIYCISDCSLGAYAEIAAWHN